MKLSMTFLSFNAVVSKRDGNEVDDGDDVEEETRDDAPIVEVLRLCCPFLEVLL